MSTFFDDDETATDDTQYGNDESMPIAGPSRLRTGGEARNGARPLQQRASTTTTKKTARNYMKELPSRNDHHANSDIDIDLSLADSEMRGMNASGKEEQETDIQKLMRHWMDERAAPELLYLQEELMNSTMERLEAQVRN